MEREAKGHAIQDSSELEIMWPQSLHLELCFPEPDETIVKTWMEGWMGRWRDGQWMVSWMDSWIPELPSGALGIQLFFLLDINDPKERLNLMLLWPQELSTGQSTKEELRRARLGTEGWRDSNPCPQEHGNNVGKEATDWAEVTCQRAVPPGY